MKNTYTNKVLPSETLMVVERELLIIKMKKIIFYIFCIILLVSCGGKTGKRYSLEDAPPIVIDIDSVKNESLKISHVKFIPLETTDECLIGEASKVLIKNDKIYVADDLMAKALFVFDLNGKFLFKIAKRGNGPGEYISLNDFDVLSNGDIYLWDISSAKIRIYDKEAKFIKDIVITSRMANFCLFEDKIYLTRIFGSDGSITDNLAVYDNGKLNVILKNEDLPDNTILASASHGFYYSLSNIYCSPKFSPIIYSIGKNGVSPAIGFKNLNMPSKAIVDEWIKNDDLFAQEKSGYFLENASIYETDRHITFSSVVGRIYLYDKHTQYVCSSRASAYTRIIGASGVHGSTGKDFFSVVSFFSGIEVHKQILETREELANWQEDDNPVIVIFNHE